LERRVIKTGDGSTTIYIPEWDEHYHSIHGAIQEAEHVFIRSGLIPSLNKFNSKDIQVLEMGFGTGLNAWITLVESEKLRRSISYTGIDAYPVDLDTVKRLNYSVLIDDEESRFLKLHNSEWEIRNQMSQYFSLIKIRDFFENITFQDDFHLIYFDAFGARVQPELWTTDIFRKMYDSLKDKGVLVTYSAKGSVRRAMLEVGFSIERLEGPPGKREMLRATKA
jgi:tRNA U34 5-methylaminomethyl-2-thiouridine-forming methyltransferase MnmC